jgi:DNA modification methylase
MNRIIHGDCRTELPKLPSRSVDLVCTDPPYVIGAIGGGIAGKRSYLKDINAKDLDQGFDFALLTEFLRVLKTPNLIIFSSRLQIREYLDWAHVLDLKWSLICWHKTNPTPLTNNNYLPDTEYIFHFWKGRKLGGRYHTKRRFYVQPIDARKSFGHPTVKPLNIVSNLIENATSEGEVVLDPFVGSGTTCVAAKMLGRRFIGIERERDYVDIARTRIRAIDISGKTKCAA